MACIEAISMFSPPPPSSMYKDISANSGLQFFFGDISTTKITKSVGINQRYVATESQTTANMACEAANKLFEEWNVDRKSIDFIIFPAQSSDCFPPTSSCTLQRRLDISTTAKAFDYGLDCSDYTYGLAMAKSFIGSGLARNVLSLTGDAISRYLHPENKNRILFGDSATATLIFNEGPAEIGETVYGTDGSGAEAIIVRNNGSKHLAQTGHEEKNGTGNIRRDDYFYMSGERIFSFTIDHVPRLIDDMLSKNDIKEERIDCYVPHQTNKSVLNTIRRVCSITKDKFYTNIENTGNTASSTIPVTLKHYLDENGIQKEQQIMTAGFGVGLLWAATVLKF